VLPAAGTAAGQVACHLAQARLAADTAEAAEARLHPSEKHCCVGRSRTAGDWSGDCTSNSRQHGRHPSVLTVDDAGSPSTSSSSAPGGIWGSDRQNESSC
jgi:hypothetical protein